jgi:hypothetical protein
MGVLRRVDQLLRPPGYVPRGSPQAQAHMARWWRWYGVTGGIGLVVVTSLSIFTNIAGVAVLGGVPMLLLLYALEGWRVTHPPKERLPD